ncbi:MAG TPA: dihydrodipicolinate synthase family protein [Thermoplasmata archaeon]|nr:dihydrodipicolinate synthase family protein [Thermoplasmata archaeon]
MTGPPAAGIWKGISVALTTSFDSGYEVDRAATVAHAARLVEAGMDSLVVGGSLGEGETLRREEKGALVETLVESLGARVPIVAAVAATRTSDAVELARGASHAGAQGLLVLPPYIYRGDRREVGEHFRAVFRATELPCMLYNNPPAYGTDVLPDLVLELAEEHPTFTAIKESSGDVRRVSALRALLGPRLDIAVGVDDAVLEAVAAGATGWVAGLANALPKESRALFDRSRAGDLDAARALYRWFLPLLRMDADPKFVQMIKLVETELGFGSTRVRPPRLELAGAERDAALATVRRALANRPSLSGA